MSAATMTSADAAEMLLKREAAVDAAELAYSHGGQNEMGWRAVADARDAFARAELDLQLIIASEIAARAAESEAVKAKARATFDAAAKDADPAAYALAARPYVRRVVEALAAAEQYLSEFDRLTAQQVAAARLAADLGSEIGMRAPPAVSDEERDRLLRVSLEDGGHGKRLCAVLEGPGVKRLRACLAYGERGMLLGQEIRRAASDRGVPSGELGLDDLEVSAAETPDWKSQELPAWRAARACMGLEGGAP